MVFLGPVCKFKSIEVATWCHPGKNKPCHEFHEFTRIFYAIRDNSRYPRQRAGFCIHTLRRLDGVPVLRRGLNANGAK
jgi:hypothetical protein